MKILACWVFEDLSPIARIHERTPGLAILLPVLWRWKQADSWEFMALHPSPVTESLMPVKGLVSKNNKEMDKW